MSALAAPPYVELARTGEVLPDPDAMADRLDVSFFVPCYNEEQNVEGAIDKLVEVASTLGLSYEILVFDDNSSDGTVEVVRRYQGRHPEIPLRLFVNRVNQGVSRNFVEAAFRGRGTYYRLICGDDVEPIETHIAVLKHLGQADIVVPYFTEIGGRPMHRHLISNLYTRLVNLCSGRSLRYYNGCPLYRRADVLRFHVEATGFGYQAEFLTRLLHEKRSFIEIPLVSIDREGSGSLNLRNFISVGHSLAKIALRRLRVRLLK
ncbi:glycosyltransferase family 2 protein [Aurantimonas sp. MSK8Z-1]|uniref:glycosyltransferase family 2 protein n=1 Tax=Mangrovibrevibacter kandeliae TaxID=2968473 RepID=UPI002118ED8A|nr:glycosyltransferase family 2 protein [Aurantimonas sp. MSK8Z-1]MCW4116986.1 glycosyltransferase family 2 protein [Aurantimonas sp. MSK8Z-1]